MAVPAVTYTCPLNSLGETSARPLILCDQEAGIVKLSWGRTQGCLCRPRL